MNSSTSSCCSVANKTDRLLLASFSNSSKLQDILSSKNSSSTISHFRKRRESALPLFGKTVKKKEFCEKSHGKQICHKIQILPPYEFDSILQCKPQPKYDAARESKVAIGMIEKLPVNTSQNVRSSKRTGGTFSDKRIEDLHRRPYDNRNFMTNEISSIGGMVPCRGNRRSMKYLQRPTEAQKIHKMRTGNYPIFSLTENPKCPATRPKNKPNLRSKDELMKCVEKVKLADNLDTPTESDTSDLYIEEMDVDNPVNLDFQGADYKETYEQDEQDLQNKFEYVKQKRLVERRILQRNINKISEEKHRKEKYSLPKVFDIGVKFEDTDMITSVQNTIDTVEISSRLAESMLHYQSDPEIDAEQKSTELVKSDEDKKLAQLYRTMNKKGNRSLLNMAATRRIARYYNLWQHRNQKQQSLAKTKADENEFAAENLIMRLGEKDFEDFTNDSNAEVMEKYKELTAAQPKRIFPHNSKETKQLKRNLNKQRREIREKARIKEEFYSMKGMQKICKEANLTVDQADVDTTEDLDLSEQSTDDEDNIEVGRKTNSKYELRGFHFKLGNEPRGKFSSTQRGKNGRPQKTCITRTEWFKSLAPDTEPAAFFEYNPSSLEPNLSPDNPNYKLFPKERTLPKSCEISPIKEHINSANQAGDLRLPPSLKLRKPKYVKVKKFNLAGYLYGTRKRHRLRKFNSESLNLKEDALFKKHFLPTNTSEGFKKEKARRIKHNRMRYLGIPFKKTTDKRNRPGSDNFGSISESESSDWIPEEETVGEESQNARRASILTLGRSNHIQVVSGPPFSATNMPAPKFREPTLRRHPRKPRVKANTSSINIPDDDISSIGKKLESAYSRCSLASQEHYNVPRLFKVEEDKVIPANVEMKKTAYTDLFEARHHHDHADAAQHKVINVKYNRKIPEKSVKTSLNIEKNRKIARTFERAQPRTANVDSNVDLSLPQIRYVPISERQQADTLVTQIAPTNDEIRVSYRRPKKTIRNDDISEGKKKYLDFIAELKDNLKKLLDNVVKENNEAFTDRAEYLKDLEEEYASIKSCVTSLESSQCTNFTHDSGSYLMIQDKKVPCDYITKSFVPFEEVDRIRVKIDKVEPNDEYNAPFYTVPFCGQKIDQKRIARTNDKFFTHTTRCHSGIRDRLEVKVPHYKDELFGTDNYRSRSKIATDVDEYYQNDLRDRPTIKLFKPKTTLPALRDSLRKKFEAMNITEILTEQTIVEKKEIEYAERIEKLKLMYDELLKNWEESYYKESMSKIKSFKPYYETTDSLKRKRNELEKTMVKMSMKIVFTEDDWIRRTILQNFHYLIMEQNWREQHDWIHRKDDGSLESYRDSIEKRKTVNIRKRGRDDAWAIKEFYDNHYRKQNHPIMIVFPDTESFFEGIVKLKSRTFICLLELHFAMWILTDLEQSYYQFKMWSDNFIEARTKFVKNSCAKKYFMEDRVKCLEGSAKTLLDRPLADEIGSPRLRTMEPLCEIMYPKQFSQNVKDNNQERRSALNKLEVTFDYLLGLIATIDKFPSKRRKELEQAYRHKLAYAKRQSRQAVLVEKRIQLAMEEVKRNMQPPFVKPPKLGKLKRTYLKKKPVVVKEVKRKVSEKSKLYYEAFSESTGKEDIQAPAEDDVELLSALQDNCIPFYFDHWLRLHDYEPNYDFQTQVEINEGPEENMFKYKDVLTDVYTNLENWQANKKKQMEADIQKTLYLYVD